MSERSGMTTTVTPEPVTAESWKVRLLPPPVGMSAKTSLPLLVALIISLWFSRKFSFPKSSLFARSTSISHSKRPYHSDLSSPGTGDASTFGNLLAKAISSSLPKLYWLLGAFFLGVSRLLIIVFCLTADAGCLTSDCSLCLT